MVVFSREDEKLKRSPDVVLIAQVKKGQDRPAMKVETLIVALLSQLIQVGVRNAGQIPAEPSIQSSTAVLQNVSYDCHCHCTHEQTEHPLWVVLGGAAVGFSIGRFATVTIQPSSGSPSPRRRGHGVLVEHSPWHSSGCVLF